MRNPQRRGVDGHHHPTRKVAPAVEPAPLAVVAPRPVERPAKLLTAAQVAALLGVSRDTVIRRARLGTLPSIQINAQVRRFRPEDFPT